MVETPFFERSGNNFKRFEGFYLKAKAGVFLSSKVPPPPSFPSSTCTPVGEWEGERLRG
jgi:hypothetical protein